MPLDRAARRRLLRFVLRPLRLAMLVPVTLYFLLDEAVPALLRPLYARLAALRLFERLATAILALPPLPTLILFLVPFAILEPFKIFALILLAKGHFVTGGTLLAVSHLASIVLVERLFRLTRPKLLQIGWFAFVYLRVEKVYEWSLGRLKATTAWRQATIAVGRVRERLRDAWARAKPAMSAAWRRMAASFGRRRAG